MALASVDSGTQTATLDTEHTLSTKTADGFYVLGVDLGNMANGDITVLRIYTKMGSGESSTLAYEATYAHVQATPNVYSIPVPVTDEVKCTLEQTDGTGRDYPWNLVKAG